MTIVSKLSILPIIFALWFAYPQPSLDLADETSFPWALARAKYAASNDNRLTCPLDGVRIVVTGATSGIGRSLALILLDMGADVIAMGRSSTKLLRLEEDYHTRLRRKLRLSSEENRNTHLSISRCILSSSQSRLTTVKADFSDLEDVSKAANKIIQEVSSIDILVNNAGIIQKRWYNNPLDFSNSVTKQGYDEVFGVNYLSHFVLTEKLMPLVRNARGTVLQISSTYHMGTNGKDLQIERHNINGDISAAPIASIPGGSTFMWRDQRSYSNSKLAQILHMRALGRQEGYVHFVSACPGWVGTGIGGESGRPMLEAFAFPVEGWGLASILTAMFSLEDSSGDFFMNTRLFGHLFYPFMYLFGDQAIAYSSGLWDLLSYVLVRFVAIFTQKFAPEVIRTKSSPASYDFDLQEGLYNWSLEVVKQYL